MAFDFSMAAPSRVPTTRFRPTLSSPFTVRGYLPYDRARRERRLRFDNRPGAAGGRKSAAVPRFREMGRRNFRRRFSQYRRNRGNREEPRSKCCPVRVQRHLAEEKELGARKPALPKRLG